MILNKYIVKIHPLKYAKHSLREEKIPKTAKVTIYTLPGILYYLSEGRAIYAEIEVRNFDFEKKKRFFLKPIDYITSNLEKLLDESGLSEEKKLSRNSI